MESSQWDIEIIIVDLVIVVVSFISMFNEIDSLYIVTKFRIIQWKDISYIVDSEIIGPGFKKPQQDA